MALKDKKVKMKEVQVEKAAPKVLKAAPLVTELVFRVGSEFTLEGVPFKVVSAGGLEVKLKRTDIK